MKAITISADGKVDRISIQENGEPLYKIIRETIGGYMENTYPKVLGENVVMIVNEEGKLLGLPIIFLGTCIHYASGAAPENFIVGDVILLKLGTFEGEADVVGFTEEEEEAVFQKLRDIVVTLNKGVSEG